MLIFTANTNRLRNMNKPDKIPEEIFKSHS